ncbi:hypothetical protein [Nocardia sp. NBC_01329]|uniref:hypothetical protein n=1 Tax=Nocardia sp. NBC_01329 TaxID=2903594 RepID=UPI002E0DAB4F|nr:hypothetical protein OG405_15090 [Nocardia sp. NBC_01329]
MVEVGDTVQIGEGGTSRFRVVEVGQVEGRATIEAVDESAPGRYPFSLPFDALVPVEPGS